VISAQDPAAVKEKVVQAGARAFLPKNAPVSELFAAIEEAMK
jgi:DNA-binding NarL/FixJ family response regulator